MSGPTSNREHKGSKQPGPVEAAALALLEELGWDGQRLEAFAGFASADEWNALGLRQPDGKPRRMSGGYVTFDSAVAILRPAGISGDRQAILSALNQRVREAATRMLDERDARTASRKSQ